LVPGGQPHELVFDGLKTSENADEAGQTEYKIDPHGKGRFSFDVLCPLMNQYLDSGIRRN